MYVTTTVFILNQSYMFQPSMGHPQGTLIHFVSQDNNLPVQMQM
jgi:hypothetical protein